MSTIDINGNSPEAGCQIRIYNKLYTVIKSPIDNKLWAIPNEAHNLFLDNWSGNYEILNEVKRPPVKDCEGK